MKTTTFTSTISPHLNDWLASYAKETNRTRRAVLETALETYKKEQIKGRMKADFARAAGNPDTINMAEWGLDDYVDLTKV
jgi:predicted transcriptional regulator